MEKSIVINVSLGETRIAILEKNTLVELFYEAPENERMVGDVYLGKVAKVVKGIQASFVNIGQRQDAFLHFSDINDKILDVNKILGKPEDSSNEKQRRPRNGDSPVKRGQPILVQVTKEPMAQKGARVTTNISIAGRFLVLIPDDAIVGVSRKIYNRREKYRLKKIARSIKPNGFGLVVRTVALGRDEASLKSDLDNLLRMWGQTVKKIKSGHAPMLIHKDMGVLSSVIRDLFTPDIKKLIIDNKKMHKQIIRYLEDVSPQLVSRVTLHTKKTPVFDENGIESQITKSLSRKVWLKQGGYIYIDHTEALTAIDVNSGRFSGRRNHDANSLKINLDAAQEIARQLRLRDIGGIIIIDFIDMVEDKNKKKLEDVFKRELKSDRAQVNITSLSEFGIIEMTRERIRPALLHSISEPCSACGGTGRVISKTTMVAKIERWIIRYRNEGGERSLQLVVHPELAKFLSAGYRSRLRRIAWKYWTRVKVSKDENIPMDDFRFLNKTGDDDLTMKYMP